MEVDPDLDVPVACPVRAIVDFGPDGFGPVFRSATGGRLSRQGILKIVRSAVAAAGLAAEATNGCLPRLPDAHHRARLANHVSQPEIADS